MSANLSLKHAHIYFKIKKLKKTFVQNNQFFLMSTVVQATIDTRGSIFRKRRGGIELKIC